jgi:L-malate glycosyltransferase
MPRTTTVKLHTRKGFNILPVQPIRYLHIFPSYEAGGAQLRIANVINFMSARDGGGNHGIMALDGNFEAAYKIDPSSGVRLLKPPPKGNPVQFIFALRKAIQNAAPGVLLTYNWGATDAVIAALPGRLCPVIHNECGLSNEVTGRKWRRIVARRVLLSRTFRTVVTSITMLRIARSEFCLPASKLQFIQTGVDVDRFRPLRNSDLRRSLGLSESDLVFGYVGGLRPVKNIGMLLRAFAGARIPGAKLAIFGDGPSRADLKNLAEQLGVKERVHFAGHQRDSAACFAAMDVAVMSSLSEQTPNALLEAMASGLPAVCTDVGDIAHLLGEAQRRFVVSLNDVQGYARALETLAMDPALRHSFGAQNRQRCLEQYTIDRMLREYASLYEQAR